MMRLLLGVAVVGFLLPVLTWAQEEGLEQDPEYQMHLRDMQMDLESRQARTEHERQMGELELEAARAELEKARSGAEGGPLALLLVLCGVVRILVATWIYQDIRQRNAGSGLWIVLGLLGGLFAALVYAVVRLGDSDDGKKRANSR